MPHTPPPSQPSAPNTSSAYGVVPPRPDTPAPGSYGVNPQPPQVVYVTLPPPPLAPPAPPPELETLPPGAVVASKGKRIGAWFLGLWLFLTMVFAAYIYAGGIHLIRNSVYELLREYDSRIVNESDPGRLHTIYENWYPITNIYIGVLVAFPVVIYFALGIAAWKRGTSPGLYVLGLHAWIPRKREVAKFRNMVMRYVVGGLVQLLMPFGILISSVLFFSDRLARTLPDHLASMVIIHDPQRHLKFDKAVPQGSPALENLPIGTQKATKRQRIKAFLLSFALFNAALTVGGFIHAPFTLFLELDLAIFIGVATSLIAYGFWFAKSLQKGTTPALRFLGMRGWNVTKHRRANRDDMLRRALFAPFTSTVVVYDPQSLLTEDAPTH